MRTLRTLLILAATAAAAFAAAQVDPNRVVVRVNGEPITGQTYFTRMQFLPGVGRMSGSNFVPGAPGLFTLQQLINEVLMFQLAQQRGVAPSEAEIDAEVARRKRDEPGIWQSFQEAGLGEAEFRWDSRYELSQFKIVTQGVNITNQEVDQFYRGNIATLYTLPRRYVLRVISVSDPANREKVDAALTAGRAWGDVAAEFSQDMSRRNEGRFATIADDDLGDPLRSEVLKLQKGGRTPWMNSGNTWAKFWLEDLLEKQVRPLDDTLRAEIRRRLMIDRGGARVNMMLLMDEMRRKAKIDFLGSPFEPTLKSLFGGG
ncbi:MAG: peptidyl-prolyl cis-trans isomerase [Fimbriimonadaceae bacterium]|nr:peptidyl-prolyl cis-trans isomerase [Fimbriimonadaceae bacterium]